ncbi:MAG: phosphatidate cytidylyltransferase [Phycisphaerales bacterium]|nr:MAG: phosphatidate cytidylyltransferase [Phycisphaerales bacterium]
MQELLSTNGYLAHPLTRFSVVTVAVALLITPGITVVLSRMGVMSKKTSDDVWVRYWTWLVLAPAMLVPLILCPASAMSAVLIMSLLCYREYARATGVFRERLMSAIVALGIVAICLASLDNWYGLFVALPSVTVTILAASAVLNDRPSGYIQRVSLATVGFLLFGVGLGHLSYLANATQFRPLLILIVMSTQASDIVAYCAGKAFGSRHVFPNTSPNKTLAGHLGSLVIVAPLSAWGLRLIVGTDSDMSLWHLLGFGLVVAAGAQLGDLVLGSIKRDLGIKDMAATLPGHGGILDRFNSILLVAPAAFHYLSYYDALEFIASPRFLGVID